jgi:hypothetical protein
MDECGAGKCGGSVFIALECSKQGRGEIWRRIRIGRKRERKSSGGLRKGTRLTHGLAKSVTGGGGKTARSRVGPATTAGLGPRKERAREEEAGHVLKKRGRAPGGLCWAGPKTESGKEISFLFLFNNSKKIFK